MGLARKKKPKIQLVSAPIPAPTGRLTESAGEFSSLSTPMRGIFSPASKSNCLSVFELQRGQAPRAMHHFRRALRSMQMN
jgi:hypothetical protein